MESLIKSFRGLRPSVVSGGGAGAGAGAGRSQDASPMRRSEYSLVSCSDVTSGVLSVWSELPELVKNDPALASFREQYEKENGPANADKTIQVESGGAASYQPLKILDDDGKDHEKDHEKDSLENGHSSPSPPREIPLTSIQMFLKYIKIAVLLVVWIFFTVAFIAYGEKEDKERLTFVIPGNIKDVHVSEVWHDPKSHLVTLLVKVDGPFLTAIEEVEGKLKGDGQVIVWLENEGADKQQSSPWYIKLRNTSDIDLTEPVQRSQRLSMRVPAEGRGTLVIRLLTNSTQTVPLGITYQLNPVDSQTGILASLVLLIGLYVLIIFEIINRTLAAVVASSSALAVLAVCGERPTLLELVSWLDVETLLLLFSMMLLVAITAETGLFDFLAVYAFSVTKGKTWPLINLLCLLTAVLSTFLDNVTTVLLMTPVTIRLCELMELNPVPVLMSMVFFCNIGGTATPVGDPPNVIIASNPAVVDAGIDFLSFTAHMGLGVLLVSVTTYLQLRYFHINVSKLRRELPNEIQDMKQQITVWRRAAATIGAHSRDEEIVRHALMKKVAKMEARVQQLVKERKKGIVSEDKFHGMLSTLKDKYKIRDKTLLYKAGLSIGFVVLTFFLHAIPEFKRISLGWTALLGAILLLILADRDDFDHILARVEWSTLLFFAALFVLMEALSKLGLIQLIGGLTESLILQVDESHRLAVAIVLMLWVSGLVSAFVDNIPLTTMMIRVVTSLGNNPALGLPMAPLIWSLSFGACLGGNGTLIGASANVVTAGVSEQHGYRINFVEFFKIGFPLMLGHLVTATVYLLVSHCVFVWH